MRMLARGEYHAFEAEGARFLYLVPSAAVFRVDDTAQAVLDALGERPQSLDDLSTQLTPRFGSEALRACIGELMNVRALKPGPMPAATAAPVAVSVAPAVSPRKRVPLTTLVLNVTSKCNLSCKYCYEYGEDKIVEPTTKPRFMNEETARASVDFLFAEAGDNRHVHLTYFGGETLLNFKVLKSSLAYAQDRARALGKSVDASLTTNATLLREEVIDWIVAHDVGVTVSMDGNKEQQDTFRVFSNGMGSYDTMIPNVRALLAAKPRKPVGARVTLTRQNLDVLSIYKHLHDEIGFWEVGFAPVTTSWERGHAIQDDGFDLMLAQFNELAGDYLNTTLSGLHHGFSNVRDTLEEIHKGMSKSHPCGAGFGLLGVATDGDVALCHRFAGSDKHKLGTVRDGLDRFQQDQFLADHHIDNKTDCATCWARPLCAGGCYHEAHTRYGSTVTPNLHYCTWIRSWTDTCLKIYGSLAQRRPEILAQFDS